MRSRLSMGVAVPELMRGAVFRPLLHHGRRTVRELADEILPQEGGT